MMDHKREPTYWSKVQYQIYKLVDIYLVVIGCR